MSRCCAGTTASGGPRRAARPQHRFGPSRQDFQRVYPAVAAPEARTPHGRWRRLDQTRRRRGVRREISPCGRREEARQRAGRPSFSPGWGGAGACPSGPTTKPICKRCEPYLLIGRGFRGWVAESRAAAASSDGRRHSGHRGDLNRLARHTEASLGNRTVRRVTVAEQQILRPPGPRSAATRGEPSRV